VDSRPATADDLDAVVATITSAFFEDPTWGWAFPDPAARAEQHARYWRIFIKSSLRQGGVFVTPGCEAATIWIPPGGEELSAAEDAEAEAALHEMLGPGAERVLELIERFDANHPHDRDHWYLSLLGTHADHRGKGIGMALLRTDLERIDAAGMPAYLESSNSANDHRYEALGFRRIGAFTTPDDAVALATMWREPGGYS